MWKLELQQLRKKNRIRHCIAGKQLKTVRLAKPNSNLALLMLTLSWAFSSPTASFGDERK